MAQRPLSKPADSATTDAAARTDPGTQRSAWWIRALASLPLTMLHGLARLLGWLACSVLRLRRDVVRDNIARCFPALDAQAVNATMARYYVNIATVFVEIIKSVALTPAQIRERVKLIDAELARSVMARGQSVLLVAAHHCNWEWMLLALALELQYPVDAAYKPLGDEWAELEMKKMRTRFGSRLVPAKSLLADIIKRRGVVRAIAMVADQEPTTSEHKHWTTFLTRETAFYMGPEEISRATRMPVFFIGMQRVRPGFYEMSFVPLTVAGEAFEPGVITERYARQVEEQIEVSPADWFWSHKRWKLKRSVYGRK